MIKFYYEDNNLEKLNKDDIELISKISLEKEEVSYFVEAKEKRETASYGISNEFSKKESEDLKEKTIRFANKIKLIIEMQ
ncbi:Uncharacterised protein [uncultured archaeon]|nr:Uncharacterised protein [uncultured archaeon]